MIEEDLSWFDDDDDDDFWFDDEEYNENSLVIGARDLIREYVLVYPEIKDIETGFYHLPRITQVIVERVYALLQAFLIADKTAKSEEEKKSETKPHKGKISKDLKIKTILEFFSFEKTKLPKISKPELEEVIAKLQGMAVERRDVEEMERNCKALHFQKNRLAALNQLIHLRLEADKCLDAFSMDTKRGLFSWNLRFLVYYNLFSKNIVDSIEKLDDIIISLLGSDFKKTFTKEELVKNYGYPDLSEDDIYQLKLENLRSKGVSDPFEALF